MKVYSTPEELPAPELDLTAGGDWRARMDAHRAAEDAHKESLREWLVAAGYTGPLTGKEYRTPRADGYARYMFADKPRGSCLIHLPYGDAWHDPDVEFIPRKEIVKRIEQQERVDAMFAARAAAMGKA